MKLLSSLKNKKTPPPETDPTPPKKQKKTKEKIKKDKQPKNPYAADWYTPWTWKAGPGLYVGQDGPWYYTTLPTPILSLTAPAINLLLEHLQTALGPRNIHILLHSQTTEPTLPDNLPPLLAQELQNAVLDPTPQTTFFLGVQVIPEKPKEKLSDTIDNALGETAPDWKTYEKDLNRITTTLNQFSAHPLNPETTAYLESWYANYKSQDLEISEQESLIVAGQNAIQAATTYILPETKTTLPLPAPGPGDKTILSLRATLSKEYTVGLTDCSILWIIMSTSFKSWPQILATHRPDIEVEALPLRQLPALDETLPCSKYRTGTVNGFVNEQTLMTLGVMESNTAGDRSGILLGSAGPAFNEPIWYNPFTEPGQHLQIIGGPQSGKTFIAEYLAMQSILSGINVRYLSDDAESGRPLVADAHLTPIIAPSPGLLGLGPLPKAGAYPKLRAEYLCQFIPEPQREEIYNIARGSSGSSPLTHPSWIEVQKLISQPSAARLHKLKKDPTTPLRFVLGQPETTSPSWVMSTPHILNGLNQPKEQQTDFLLSSVIALPVSGPTIIIAEECNIGPLTKAALEDAKEIKKPISLITTHYTLPTTDCPAQNRLLLGTLEKVSEGLAWVGSDPEGPDRDWLYDAWPELVNFQIIQPASALFKDHLGRSTRLKIYPASPDMIRSLTREDAEEYASRITKKGTDWTAVLAAFGATGKTPEPELP